MAACQSPPCSCGQHQADHTPPLKDHFAKLSFADCVPQEHSPLFSTIPPEIRNMIFGLALAEQNGNARITSDEYYYRPDYTHHRYIDTALLSTCRRVYMETRDLPQRNVTCRFWIGNVHRAAPLSSLQGRATQASEKTPYVAFEYNENDELARLFDLLDENLDRCRLRQDDEHYSKRLRKTMNITRFRPRNVQLFPQLYALEGEPMKKFMRDLSTQIRPRTLTITIRYTDWWFWESNSALRFYNTKWMNNFKVPTCIEELTIEFETRNGKKAEMDVLVKDQASKWRFEVGDAFSDGGHGGDAESYTADYNDGRYEVREEEKVFLVAGDTAPVSSTWIGSAKVGRAQFSHHSQEANGTKDLGKDEMLYYVVTMVWRREKREKKWK